MSLEEEVFYVIGFESNPLMISNSFHNANQVYSVKSEIDFINGSFEKLNFHNSMKPDTLFIH